MKKSYQSDTRETAYQAWRKSGQNVMLTVRGLKKAGYLISAPTIYDWVDKYGWKARAARAEAEEQKMKDAAVNAEGNALASLETVRTRYEKYFETLGDAGIDNQAMFAYTGIIKSIAEIKIKMGSMKAGLFIEFMRDLIDWLSKNDTETVGAIEKNFDDFVSYAREKYGH